jgi:hypothetical protein
MSKLEREVMLAEVRVYRKAIRAAALATAAAVAEAKKQAARARLAERQYNTNQRIKDLEQFIKNHLKACNP